MMPSDAVYVFTQASGKRALPAETVRDRYLGFCTSAGRDTGDVHCAGTVIEALDIAYGLAASAVKADPAARPLVYVGGSTYVVAEAVSALKGK